MKTVDIDDVLSPYADDQPKYLEMQETDYEVSTVRNIERIPRLVDNNGEINPEFQIFYNHLVKYVCEHNIDGLYEISDKSISKAQFTESYEENISKKLKKFYSAKYNNRGLDMEVNLSRFEKKHRNLIGGIYLMTYLVKDSEFEGISTAPALEQMFTEILFTYKQGGFCILSVFSPFKNCEDE